jgi:hypothetical protein
MIRLQAGKTAERVSNRPIRNQTYLASDSSLRTSCAIRFSLLTVVFARAWTDESRVRAKASAASCSIWRAIVSISWAMFVIGVSRDYRQVRWSAAACTRQNILPQRNGKSILPCRGRLVLAPEEAR